MAGASGVPLLLGGPQTGLNAPSFFWEVGLAHPRLVAGFFSPADLGRLLFIRQNRQPLGGGTINKAIVDRPYQHEAIRRWAAQHGLTIDQIYEDTGSRDQAAKRPEFQNKSLRQGLNYAVNKEELAAKLYSGAAVAETGVLP